MSEINIDYFISLYTSYISSTIERTNLCGIRNIRLTISRRVEHHLWFDTDRHGIHIFIKLRLTINLLITCKVHLTEVNVTIHVSLIQLQEIRLDQVFSVTAEEHFVGDDIRADL